MDTNMAAHHSRSLALIEYEDTETAALNNESILDSLRNLGWGNGFNNPFADKSNKDLEFALDKAQRTLLEIRGELEDLKKHVADGHTNCGYLEKGISFSQSLINTTRREVQNESRMIGDIERIKNAQEREIVRMTKDLKDISSRRAATTAEADKKKLRVDELLYLVQTDSDLLEIYKAKKEAHLGKVDESIENYKTDENSVVELEVHETNLEIENQKLVKTLNHAAIDTVRLQEQFSQLSTEFRRAHRQRNELVTMWASTLDAMKSRDKHMIEVVKDFQIQQSNRRQIFRQVEYKQFELKSELDKSGELQDKIDAVYKNSCTVRENLAQMKEFYETYKNEKLQLNVLIRQTTQQIHAFEQQKTKNTQAINSINEKCSILDEIVRCLKEHKDSILNSHMSAGEYLIELDKLEIEDSKARAELEEKVALMSDLLREKYDQYKEAVDAFRNESTKYAKLESWIKSLENTYSRQIDAINKNQSTMYKIDLETSTLEARISNALVIEIQDNFFKLRNTLKQRQTQLGNIMLDQKFIQDEINQMNYKFHKFSKELEHQQHEQTYFETALHDVSVELQKLISYGENCNSELREIRIFHSLRLVDKKRLSKLVVKCNENIFTKNQHYFTVQAAVKERKSEITYHLKLLNKLRRQLKTTVGRLGSDLGEVDRLVGKIKSKFDQLSVALQSPDGDSSIKDSFAEQIRRATQEREGLTQILKQWETRISEGQKELEGLNNVFLTMKASNLNFQESLLPAKPNSKELKQYQRLAENEKKAMVLRNRCQRLKSKFLLTDKALTNEVGVLKLEIQKKTALCEQKTVELSKLHSAIVRYKEKIQRWESSITRISRQLLEVPTGYIEIVEKSLHHKAVFLKYEQAISRLQALLAQDPKVDFKTKILLQDAYELLKDITFGPQLVQPPSSSVSSKSSRERVTRKSIMIR